MNDRTIHQDLLSQVERDEKVRDDVRRVLSRAQTDADISAQFDRWRAAPFAAGATNQERRSARRACSRCESGLAHCTTPEACERAATQDDDAIGAFRGLVNSLPYAVLAWLAVAVAIATVLSIWPT